MDDQVTRPRCSSSSSMWRPSDGPAFPRSSSPLTCSRCQVSACFESADGARDRGQVLAEHASSSGLNRCAAARPLCTPGETAFARVRFRSIFYGSRRHAGVIGRKTQLLLLRDSCFSCDGPLLDVSQEPALVASGRWCSQTTTPAGAAAALTRMSKRSTDRRISLREGGCSCDELGNAFEAQEKA